MDIPAILGEISEGIFQNLYWGPCANSSNTYEELKDCWPKDNPELPSKQDMEDYWRDNFENAQELSFKSSPVNQQELSNDRLKKIEEDVAKIKNEIKNLNRI